jgi:hypothetical protein
MTIAVTICSNNFLAQAKTMLDSLGQYHPEIKSLLFIVDHPAPGIDYTFFKPSEVRFIDEKVVEGFDQLLARYNIIELNTAVRPQVFQYVRENYQPDTILYLDPDIRLYSRMDEALDKLKEAEILVTPHFISPLPIDGKVPFENLALNYGTYNMGFFGIRSGSQNVSSFLDWWRQRTTLFGHIDPSNGYFTDQIWFNLVPIFFKNVHSLLHPGYNMAAWNLHERKIASYEEDGRITLTSGNNLVLYHFSSWNYNEPLRLSSVYNRFDFQSRPDLVNLYRDYHLALRDNWMEAFMNISCTLPYYRVTDTRSPVKKMLAPGVNLMRQLWRRI